MVSRTLLVTSTSKVFLAAKTIGNASFAMVIQTLAR
jgi:hypothetical protein